MLEKKLRERATAPFSPDVDGGIENAIMTAPNFFSAPNSKETRKLTEQVKSGGGGGIFIPIRDLQSNYTC